MATPELIDAYASGHRVDPTGYFERLSPDELTSYVEAKIEGFVVLPRRHRGQRPHYYHWCWGRNYPFIYVAEESRRWHLHYDADTTGYPCSCNPGPGVGEWLLQEWRKRDTARNAEACAGEHHMAACGLRREDAIELARGLWARVKDHCKPPIYRDRFELIGEPFPPLVSSIPEAMGVPLSEV